LPSAQLEQSKDVWTSGLIIRCWRPSPSWPRMREGLLSESDLNSHACDLRHLPIYSALEQEIAGQRHVVCVRGPRPTNCACYRYRPDQYFCNRRCPVMAADQVIRWTTAGAVVGVAAVASYEHAYALVRADGEAGWAGRLVPLTVDGLIYASSMVMLDCARWKVPVPALARWLLGLGIAATLAANVAHGLGHGLAGAVVAAWPAVALVGSYELLMIIIRSAQVPGIGLLPVRQGQPARPAAGHLRQDPCRRQGRPSSRGTGLRPRPHHQAVPVGHRCR
jgi:hypothetical protein